MMRSRGLVSSIIIIVMLLMALLPLLTSCGLYDAAMEQFDNTQEKAKEVVTGAGDVTDTIADTVKQDSYSAKDAIEEKITPQGELVYYDEKSGSYVTKGQYRANSFADSLKMVWIPISVGSFVVGFLIRRFVQSSAAVRRFALVLELAVPILLTILVYAVCGVADSDAVHLFDKFF